MTAEEEEERLLQQAIEESKKYPQHNSVQIRNENLDKNFADN